MFVQYDANGVRGASRPIPGSIRSFSDIIPYGTDYLVATGPSTHSSIARLDAAFNVVWQQQLTSRGINVFPTRVLALPGNKILVGSESYANRIALHTLDSRGQVLHDTAFVAPGSLFVKGLAVDPPTGDYIFAGYSNNGPIGSSDIFWTQLHHRVITSTRASQVPGQRWQAYPNPLAADGRLHLQGEQPLRGTLRLRDALGRQLASWPASGLLSQTLSMPPALPTGTYLLTLESPDLPPRTLRLVQP